MYPLLCMSVMIDFISMGFTELLGTGSKRQIQNEIEPATNRVPTLGFRPLKHIDSRQAEF